MKKKTIGAVLMSVIMTIAATLSLIGCGKGGEVDNHAPDTSFEGSISAQSYETVDAAAQAFVTEEIVGKATAATFVSYEKSSELTEEEIAELNLGDDFEYTVDQIESAENGVVSYSDSVSPASAVLSSVDVVLKTARVVIIKIGSVYWYFVPLFKNGDVLTNSYMDNILDFNKYRNMTQTTVSTTVAKKGIMSATTKVTVTIKIDGNKVHFKQVAQQPNKKETTEYYIVFSGSMAAMYEYDEESGWYVSKNGLGTVDEFLEKSFAYDASYFVKTKSGFKMNADKLTQYLNDVFSELITGYTIKSATADYYVADGRLDSATTKINMNVKNGSQTITATATATAKYSNFGTTEIELPFQI